MPQPAPQPRTRQEFHRCIRAAATPLTSLLFSCTLRLHCVTPGRACRHFRRSRHHAAPVGRGTVQNFSCADCPWRSPTRFSLLRPWSRSQAVAHSARTTRGGGISAGCGRGARGRRRDGAETAGIRPAAVACSHCTRPLAAAPSEPAQAPSAPEEHTIFFQAKVQLDWFRSDSCDRIFVSLDPCEPQRTLSTDINCRGQLRSGGSGYTSPLECRCTRSPRSSSGRGRRPVRTTLSPRRRTVHARARGRTPFGSSRTSRRRCC
jgi:hypothetical protein